MIRAPALYPQERAGCPAHAILSTPLEAILCASKMSGVKGYIHGFTPREPCDTSANLRESSRICAYRLRDFNVEPREYPRIIANPCESCESCESSRILANICESIANLANLSRTHSRISRESCVNPRESANVPLHTSPDREQAHTFTRGIFELRLRSRERGSNEPPRRGPP